MLTKWHQLLLALVFLTRIPLERLMPRKILPTAASAWAFPLVGALVGAIASLPLLLPGPPLLLAVLAVAVAIAVTGALHEDALADFADAAGGKNRDQRLDIMRDSHVGAFAVVSLVIVCAIRVVAISELDPAHVIAAFACARAAIVLTMGALLPARRDGLGHAAGPPGARNVFAAATIAMICLWVLTDGWVLPLLAGLAATSFTIWQARKWLGGQSGDVLGSASILTETAMLAAMALTV